MKEFIQKEPSPIEETRIKVNRGVPDYDPERFNLRGDVVLYEGVYYMRKASAGAGAPAKRTAAEMLAGVPVPTPQESWNGYTNTNGRVVAADKENWIIVGDQDAITRNNWLYVIDTLVQAQGVSDFERNDAVLIKDARTAAEIAAGDAAYSEYSLITEPRNAGGPVTRTGTWADSIRIVASRFPAGSAALDAITSIGPTPTAAGNTTNLNSVFSDINGDTWFVDLQGDAIKLNSQPSPDRVVISATNTVPVAAPPYGVDTHVLANGSTYYWDGAAWVAAPASGSVIAEYGEQVLGVSVPIPTASTNTVNATDILSFTLPSAGVWEVDYIIRGSTPTILSSASAGMAVSAHDNSNVLVPNSELKLLRESHTTLTTYSSDLQATGTGKVYITTTGAATYKIRGYHDGTAGSLPWVAQSDNNGRTKVSWNKISGQVPVTGQSLEYIQVGSFATNIPTTAGAALVFPNVISGNIPYNTANGQFTLTAGKTYRLEGSPTGGLVYWYNVTGAANITNHNAGNSSSAAANIVAVSYFTPVVNSIVELRSNVTSFQSAGNSITNGSVTAVIQQIGSSATTQFIGATAGAPGTSGFTPAPAAGQQTSFLRGDGTWAAPANVLSNPANAIRSTVNGVASTLTPAAGTIAKTLGFNAAGTLVNQSAGIGGNVVAMTPIRSPVETVISFDGFEMKWHNGAAAGYDGLAIRSVAGNKNITYVDVEFYSGLSVHDSGLSTWGSSNMFNNVPSAGAIASLNVPAWPHHYTVGAAWLGIGNPALPNICFRHYMLYDHTGNNTYRVTFHKNGSTGEGYGAVQNGYGMIIIERIGLTSQTIVPVYTGATALAAGTAGIVPPAPAGFQRGIPQGDGTWMAVRRGNITIGDVGAGTVATGDGDITSVTKTTEPGGSSSIVVNFAAMPTANYVVMLTPVGFGNVALDNDVRTPIVYNKTPTSFAVLLEEMASVLQNYGLGMIIMGL